MKLSKGDIVLLDTGETVTVTEDSRVHGEQVGSIPGWGTYWGTDTDMGVIVYVDDSWSYADGRSK